jgi:hypothetical protein
MKRSFTRTAVLVLSLTAIGACDSTDAFGPEGEYEAYIFTTTSGTSAPTNQLVLGSSLQLNLNADGTTSGHLHLAASGGDPAFDADMTGTWTQDEGTIDITQAADTFVRDMIFRMERLGGNELILTGDQVFDGTRINLALGRN